MKHNDNWVFVVSFIFGMLLFACFEMLSYLKSYAIGSNLTKVIDYPNCTAAEQSFLNDYYSAVENGAYSAFAMQNSSSGSESLTLFIFESAAHTTIYPDSLSPYNITFNDTELKNFRSMQFTFNGTAYVGNSLNSNSIKSGSRVGQFTAYVPYLSSGVTLSPAASSTTYANLVDYNISALMLRDLNTGNHKYISSNTDYTPPTSSSSSSSSSTSAPSSSSSSGSGGTTPPFDSGGFISDIIGGVKGIFVPSNENIVQDSFDEIKAAFNEKLADGALSATKLEDEVGKLKNGNYDETIPIVIPQNAFFEGSVGITDDLANYIKPVADFLKPILTGICCILTFVLCRSKIVLLLKGE